MSEAQLKKKIHIQWSSNFAYAIGLIASDGYLNKDERHIGFCSKDLELIKKFKQSLILKNKITRYARGGETEKIYYQVHFGDKVFYQFLNHIGITSKKSKTIQSVDIPDEFFRDFIRGLFDGDGTFYTFWDKRWPNSFAFKLSFASASLTFIEWFQSRLTSLYNVKGTIHKGAGVYNLEYVKGDSRTLFTEMYYADDLLFLNRKYLKIKSALEKDKKFGMISLQKHNMPR